MKLGAIGRFGFAVIAGAALGLATGCAPMAGWRPPPPAAGPVAAQQGAPQFVQTTGMKLTKKEEAVKVPSWIRVQDCAIVAISSPSRYACPDGKVYTSIELYQAGLAVKQGQRNRLITVTMGPPQSMAVRQVASQPTAGR